MIFELIPKEKIHDTPKDVLETLYYQSTMLCKQLSEQIERRDEQDREREEQNRILAEQNKLLTEQNAKLLAQMDSLKESIAILTQHRFGRKTEKTANMIDGQLVFDAEGNILVLNEIEQINDTTPEEKSEEELLEEFKRAQARKRKPGKRTHDLRFAKTEDVQYTLSDEELKERFPNGYREMKEDIGYRVEYEPMKLTVICEHIHVYKDNSTGEFVRADHPKHLLAHSVVTPSLISGVINAKYVDAIPVNRFSRDIGWNDVELRPQTMSRWTVNLTEKYLFPVFEHMKRYIFKAKLIHCDETPFIVERNKNQESWMWVYHTADRCGSPPIFIYDYRPDRKSVNVEEFLEGYAGIIMADGYEPYHKVARESNGTIIVAGCWAHCKRKFANLMKSDKEKHCRAGSIAFEGNSRVDAIYHIDNMAKGMTPEERLKHRQENVAPLVNSFFKWAHLRVDFTGEEKEKEALQYAINQEKYLRVFLTNGIIPLDNNDAERSIRSFCIGKHSWHICATPSGAHTSGVLYSLAETAKVNGLKPYEYFKFLFEQMLENENNVTDEFLTTIMPWSETLPEHIKAKNISKSCPA